MSYYRFIVQGEPVPKARARVVKGHAFTPARTAQYEARIRWVARANKVKPMDGPVVLGVNIYVGNKRRVDGSNILKALEDAMNGVAYRDDSQIVECHWTKAVDPSDPRVVVTISSLEVAH